MRFSAKLTVAKIWPMINYIEFHINRETAIILYSILCTIPVRILCIFVMTADGGTSKWCYYVARGLCQGRVKSQNNSHNGSSGINHSLRRIHKIIQIKLTEIAEKWQPNYIAIVKYLNYNIFSKWITKHITNSYIHQFQYFDGFFERFSEHDIERLINDITVLLKWNEFVRLLQLR